MSKNIAIIVYNRHKHIFTKQTLIIFFYVSMKTNVYLCFINEVRPSKNTIENEKALEHETTTESFRNKGKMTITIATNQQ